MKRPLPVLVGAVMAAAFSAGPRPGVAELTQALWSGREKPQIRGVQCVELGDPTEFRCRYQEQVRGRWAKMSVVVASDGGKWIVLDGPSPAAD